MVFTCILSSWLHFIGYESIPACGIETAHLIVALFTRPLLGNYFESNWDSGCQQLTAWRVAFCQMAKPCHFLATRVVNGLASSCQYTIMMSMHWIEETNQEVAPWLRYALHVVEGLLLSHIDATWCNTMILDTQSHWILGHRIKRVTLHSQPNRTTTG